MQVPCGAICGAGMRFSARKLGRVWHTCAIGGGSGIVCSTVALMQRGGAPRFFCGNKARSSRSAATVSGARSRIARAAARRPKQHPRSTRPLREAGSLDELLVHSLGTFSSPGPPSLAICQCDMGTAPNQNRASPWLLLQLWSGSHDWRLTCALWGAPRAELVRSFERPAATAGRSQLCPAVAG
jgi:hypothetical protein